ncbi:MAG: type IV secretion system protein [Mesorhizobium sp.]|uniref:type IV secretion system protein n=1 Tax=unclassified Mesorhizobium TaxID=325217 RepID=UPI000FD9B368|nr:MULTISPECIES: type IV secretion system protein [unclassified Mesorhizobium]TGV84657.1 type IV secretion system protein [Mesorhizobium sp. M00.F.Ca.ET.158.01.1.1]RWD01472.1 MAG: type IV secretion system protein [Mesorhizobium sp.]RWE19924.1 MAG: type IV secretion system protein [Mesorhizobium sp.]TGQ21280.1 type IV secretion system protein [Mesorhizobium sp. M00.F.Ca.ET.217.01.1.1]TKB35344.1 MAG: type IV secretion system protein [Mesorhizobium sp.]
MNFKIPAPFTAIHTIFHLAFTSGLHNVLKKIQEAISAPLVACVTLWIIIQGCLVMRGQVDARGGITRVIMVSIVVSLILGQANYQIYIETVFDETIPRFAHGISGSNLPFIDIPQKLDWMFASTQYAFQMIASEIGPMNSQDIIAFEGAQWIFYGSLWTAFEIYDAVGILTKVLLAIGPLVLVGYLFDHTRDMATRWIGQLLSYGLLLLLLNIVATIVIAAEAASLIAMLLMIRLSGTTAAKIIGLYELDMLFLAGDALIIALPTIASSIAGGSWAGANRSLNNLNRHFAKTAGR